MISRTILWLSAPCGMISEVEIPWYLGKTFNESENAILALNFYQRGSKFKVQRETLGSTWVNQDTSNESSR